MDIGFIKNFLTNLMQNYLTDLGDIATPDIADVTTMDSFSADKQGGEDGGSFEKLGLERKTARVVTKTSDLRGEIVKEADKSKIFDKLVHDGHVGDTHAAERELQFILEDLADGQPQNQRTAPTQQPQVFAPVQALRGEVQESFEPFLDDEPERDGHGDDGRSGDEEPGEDADSEETNLSLQAKSHYQKMNTFA
jgi:hypothetical protein